MVVFFTLASFPHILFAISVIQVLIFVQMVSLSLCFASFFCFSSFPSFLSKAAEKSSLVSQKHGEAKKW